VNLIFTFKEWRQGRRDTRAKHLSDDYVDIVTLRQRGILWAKGSGESITHIQAQIESRVRVPIKVLVPHGTYFVSTGSHQNMVTRCEYRFELGPMSTEEISVAASCINARLAIPKDSDGFYGVSRVSTKLRRFLEAAAGEDPMTVQAGVWAITDGYSASQIQGHLRKQVRFRPLTDIRDWRSFRDPEQSSPFSPFRNPFEEQLVDDGSAVSDQNIERARIILQELKIGTNL